MSRRRNKNKSSEGVSYWQSYSDMMAALLLMFVLIMALTLLRSLSTYDEKEAQLEKAREAAIEQQLELSKQQTALESAHEIVREQQQQIDNLIGVRADLIHALSNEFVDSDMQVKIDPQTGAIAFDASVLFDTAEYDIKETGQQFLQEFIPKYFKVVLNDKFKEFIAEIIIEGHTDTIGSYSFNLQLSQQRAYAVAEYCLTKSDLSSFDINTIHSILTANGRSFSNPVYLTSGEVDLDASRRVEFKFRLKEDEMIQQLKDILEGQP